MWRRILEQVAKLKESLKPDRLRGALGGVQRALRWDDLKRTPWLDRFKWPWDVWAVAVLTLAGAFLRLWKLGAAGLWRDEAQGLFVAAKSFPNGIAGALIADGHPPLYFFLMHFWAKLWGSNEFGIRLLPALFGIAAIPLLYGTARSMFNRHVAVLAAGVGAFLPMHVLVSRQARMYTLLPLLALLSIWALYGAVQHNMRRYWVGWVVASALMMYSHNWGILVFVAENIFVLWHEVSRRRQLSFVGAWLASAAGAGLLYLPWLPTLLEQFRIPGIVMGPWVQSDNSPVGHFFRIFNELTSMTWPADRPWPYVILLVIGALSFRLAWKKVSVGYEFSPALDLTVLTLLIPVLLGILITTKTQGLLPSYVTMALFPPLCFLLARALSGLRPAYSLMALAILALLFWYNPLRGIYGKPMSAMREVAQYVEAQAAPEDVILIAPDYLATPFNFYFKGEQLQSAFPQPPGRVEEIIWRGWRARWDEAQEAVYPTIDFVEQSGASGGRVWLIAPLDAYPNDPHFGQIRVLKGELDARYELVQEEKRFRNVAVESADIFLYQRRQ